MAKSAPTDRSLPAPRLTVKLPHETHRLAFSRDGRILASHSEMLETHAVDAATGEPLVGERLEDGFAAIAALGQQMMAAMAAGQDASSLMPDDIMHHEFGGPQLTPAGQALARQLRGPTGVEPFDQAAGLTKKPKFPSRRLAPDGKLFAVIEQDSRDIRLIDSRTHKVVRSVGEKAAETLPPREFAADGSVFAIPVERARIGVWATSTGKPVAHLEGHLHPVQAVAVAPDGAMLASSDESGVVAGWSLKDGKAVGWLGGFKERAVAMAFASDAGRSLLAVVDDASLGLFELPSLATRVRIERQALKVRAFTAVAASPDGSQVAIGAGKRVFVYDTPALLKHTQPLERDKVKPVPAPSREEQDAAKDAFARQIRAPMDADRDRIEDEIRAIFDRLPPKTARVHFEAEFTGWSPKETGVYWGAQNRRGQTLLAFKLPAMSEAIKPAIKARAKVKHLTFEQLVTAEREALAGFLRDVWQSAKARAGMPKVGAVLTGSFDVPLLGEKTMTDVETGELLDYAKHRYPR